MKTVFIGSILILVIVMVFTGCVGTAAFGSNGEVLDKAAAQRISFISIMPVTIKGLSEDGMKSITSDSITSILENNLNSKSVFKLLSSEKISAKADLKSDDTTLREFLTSGAFLKAEIKYYTAAFGDINATMTLVLIKPGSDEIIAYSSHDTNMGNTYFLPPTIDGVTNDAIEGAVNKMVSIVSLPPGQTGK